MAVPPKTADLTTHWSKHVAPCVAA